MATKICRHYKPLCATIDFHLKHCPRHRDVLTNGSRNAQLRPMTTTAMPSLPDAAEGSQNQRHDPQRLPNPWLLDSEKLLRELDRCREMVLLIPTPSHETYFAANVAISALWNLREDLRYILSLHLQGQRAFAQRHNEKRDPPNPPLRAVGKDSTEGKRKRAYSSSGRNGPYAVATHEISS